MGRYYTEYTNRRHKTYGAQILEGDGVHTRGWDAGARVTMRAVGPDGTADAAEVYMTWGSHDSGTAVHVGTVYDTPEGPVWVPATMPARRKRRVMPARLRAIRSPRKPPRRATQNQGAWVPRLNTATVMAAIAGTGDEDERHPEWRPDQSTTPEDTLARIDAALAGPALDSAVFGPESNLAGEY
jgi:hypothetical protein